MRFDLAAVAAVSAVAPAGAFAVDYLSAEQAEKLIFPAADRFETREVLLDAARLRQVEAAGVRPRSQRWVVRVARQGDVTLGWVVADDVIGKFERITYAVGVGADGAIRQVEVLSYRESHGHEIRLPAWRRQFVGKTLAAPIKLGDDIANVSGATLSCGHVTEGVRRIVAVIDVALREKLL